eukprot:TRINITY_DN8757_c0_g1::TRINITY_DN8757_c0_g1_i1::g.23931::m.23931 TRINITY_DN8757_c0_g1::TRINITY_DN8757_c0_g1_i1::g.23931  ORF type:complete len:127 (+),score=-15.99,Glyco_hydro_16/PF00722.16/0.036 TRINITY_DN8757_c0_g1_i1:1513-1893(+)
MASSPNRNDALKTNFIESGLDIFHGMADKSETQIAIPNQLRSLERIEWVLHRIKWLRDKREMAQITRHFIRPHFMPMRLQGRVLGNGFVHWASRVATEMVPWGGVRARGNLRTRGGVAVPIAPLVL